MRIKSRNTGAETNKSSHCSNKGKKLLAGGGVAAALSCLLHAPCIIAISSATLGLGTYAYTCHNHQAGDPQTLQNLEREVGLPRLHKVPSQFTDLTNDDQRLNELLITKPSFRKIIDWKRASDPDAKEIKVDFIQGPDGEELGVVCKDGKLCPCSDPLVYKTSNSSD